MTWHTVVVARDELNQLLVSIRRFGGSVTHSLPCRVGYTVTYVTRED
jgi:hypothetical protein